MTDQLLQHGNPGSQLAGIQRTIKSVGKQQAIHRLRNRQGSGLVSEAVVCGAQRACRRSNRIGHRRAIGLRASGYVSIAAHDARVIAVRQKTVVGNREYWVGRTKSAGGIVRFHSERRRRNRQNSNICGDGIISQASGGDWNDRDNC